MGTVCPSLTLISLSTPADGDGISASTLSVEISKSGSSRSTLSPGFFSHLVMVPSKMLSPIWGITTSDAITFSLLTPKNFASYFRQLASMPHAMCLGLPVLNQDSGTNGKTFLVRRHIRLILRQLARSVEDFFLVREKVLFERWRIGNRRIERGHAHQRSVEIAEGAFAQYRGNFAGDAAGLGVFVHDQAFTGLLERGQNRFF